MYTTYPEWRGVVFRVSDSPDAVIPLRRLSALQHLRAEVLGERGEGLMNTGKWNHWILCPALTHIQPTITCTDIAFVRCLSMAGLCYNVGDIHETFRAITVSSWVQTSDLTRSCRVSSWFYTLCGPCYCAIPPCSCPVPPG